MQEHEAQGGSQTKITTGDTEQFKALVDLIRNDGFAMSFQSVKQYRQAVLKAAQQSRQAVLKAAQQSRQAVLKAAQQSRQEETHP